MNIKVPEIYLKILKPGLIAEVRSDAFDKIFYGKIDSVSSRVDPSTVQDQFLQASQWTTKI